MRFNFVSRRPADAWTPRGGCTSTATPPVSPNVSTWTPRRHPEHQPASFPSPALSLLSASSSASSAANQPLRSSSPPRLRPSQPAKSFARASSTMASPPWPLLSAGKVALPSSEPFFLAGVPPELTGDVARPPYSTISSLFCS